MFSDLVIQLQAVSTLWKHSINSRKPSRPMGVLPNGWHRRTNHKTRKSSGS